MDNELLKEQLKWIADRVDRMDSKLDKLIQSHSFFKGRVLGACAAISLIAAILVAWIGR